MWKPGEFARVRQGMSVLTCRCSHTLCVEVIAKHDLKRNVVLHSPSLSAGTNRSSSMRAPLRVPKKKARGAMSKKEKYKKPRWNAKKKKNVMKHKSNRDLRRRKKQGDVGQCLSDGTGTR